MLQTITLNFPKKKIISKYKVYLHLLSTGKFQLFTITIHL